MKLKSPLLFVLVSRLTPVASLPRVTVTPPTTAPVESDTRPMMRPPVLWPDAVINRLKRERTTVQTNAERRSAGENMKRLQAFAKGQKLQEATVAAEANLAIIPQG